MGDYFYRKYYGSGFFSSSWILPSIVRRYCLYTHPDVKKAKCNNFLKERPSLQIQVTKLDGKRAPEAILSIPIYSIRRLKHGWSHSASTVYRNSFRVIVNKLSLEQKAQISSEKRKKSPEGGKSEGQCVKNSFQLSGGKFIHDSPDYLK